jgi:hemolysin III
MALGGILVKSFAGIRWPRPSTVLYLEMGWVALIAIKHMWQLMPGWGLFWLVAGGLAYTLSVVFFVLDGRVR